MGLIDDAQDALNDVENKFHEEKGKVEGYMDAKKDEADDACDCGKEGCTCKKGECDC